MDLYEFNVSLVYRAHSKAAKSYTEKPCLRRKGGEGKRINNTRDGEIAQRLRALIALSEDLSLVLNTHVGSQLPTTPVSRDQRPLADFIEHLTCMWYIYTHEAKHSYTRIGLKEGF